MSLKAKLEAVIYAAEEPVTLSQLAALFAGEALEWKAAQQAAAAEQTAEVANPAQTLPLIDEGLEYLGLADRPEVYAEQPPEAPAAADAPVAQADSSSERPASAADPEGAGVETSPPADTVAAPLDPETEAKREARQRDRDIKALLKHLLDELIAEYTSDERGVEIREIAGGYRMATKPECHDAVRLFVKSLKPPLKLSLPALETLAVVAYKQPVTAPEVSEIRGVESGGVLGSLLSRKLIATAGRKQVIGRPILYKTTKEFLLRFGLKDLAELPSMEEFEKMAAEIEEMEPEAVAADAAEDATEVAALEDNSPSGEELARGEELLEGASSQDQSAESVAPGTPAASNQVEEEAQPGSQDNAAPVPSHQPAPQQQPAPLQQESEAVPHAEKVQQES
jgi:segregation and condensation protein B